jgi:hypothetical protein
MSATEAQKQAGSAASDEPAEEKKDYTAHSVDDAASSTYKTNDDIEKAQPHDRTESVVEGDDVAGKKREIEKDPNIVDFDGDNDPECALNWSTKKKWITGGLLSAMTFVTFVLPASCQFPLFVFTNKVPH